MRLVHRLHGSHTPIEPAAEMGITDQPRTGRFEPTVAGRSSSRWICPRWGGAPPVGPGRIGQEGFRPVDVFFGAGLVAFLIGVSALGDFAERAEAAFFRGAGGLEALRWALTELMLALRTSMRSATLVAAGAGEAPVTISRPWCFSSTRASTFARWVSWYVSGSHLLSIDSSRT